MFIVKTYKSKAFFSYFNKLVSKSAMTNSNCTVAVCQLTSNNNKEANLKSVKKLIEQAAVRHAKIVFLPEGCDYIGNNKEEIKNLAETLDGALMEQYKLLAKSHKVWLSIGGFHEIVQNHNKKEAKLNNSHVIINNNGEIVSVYRKLHLFDVCIPERNINLRESDNVIGGTEIVPPVHTPAGPVGLCVCYDIRFPELSVLLRKKGASILTFPSAFMNTTGQAHWEVLLRARAIENQCYVIAAAQYGRHNDNRVSFGQAMCYDIRFPELSVLLRKKGASILTFPSAFMNTTGQAHWEVLLRARAIENQCYVIAAAQYGRHNDNRVSFGQAMIVDPWGKIIAECPKYTEDKPSDESIAIAEINSDIVRKVRTDMPVWQHRREDIYCLSEFNCKPVLPDHKPIYMFADKVIQSSTVFYCTKHSFAFTNIRCVVPGHVLVSSIRLAKRLEDLTLEEVADLFQATVRVQKVVETVYRSSSSTICVQDGQYAGQTVPQIHCHILPRKPGDFARNDDVYQELANHDRDNSTPTRTFEEMTEEASTLRKFFYE